MCAPDTARTAKRDELDSQSSGPSDKLIKTERRDPTFLLSREQGTPAIVSRVHTPMLAINVPRNSDKMKDGLRQEITYENYITLTDSGLDWNKSCFVHWSWSLQRELLVLVPHCVTLNEPDDEDVLNEISYLFSASCRSSFPKEDFFSLRSAFARRFLPLWKFTQVPSTVFRRKTQRGATRCRYFSLALTTISSSSSSSSTSFSSLFYFIALSHTCRKREILCRKLEKHVVWEKSMLERTEQRKKDRASYSLVFSSLKIYMRNIL